MFRGLSRSEHHVTLAIAAVLLIGASILQFRGQRSYAPVIKGAVIEHAPGKLAAAQLSADPIVKGEAAVPPAAVGLVDLNTATQDLLEALPGIGPSKAAAIIAYRDQHGPFGTVRELTHVPGIGEKTLMNLSPLITVSVVATPLPPPATAVHAEPVTFPAVPLRAETPIQTAPAVINLNRATVEQLEELDGVGPALAKRIVEDRALKGPFRSVDDLVRVKGIGNSILDRNRQRLSVQ